MNAQAHKQDIDALWLPIIETKGMKPTLAMMVTDSFLRNGIFSDSTLNSQIMEASKVFDCRFCGATFSNTKDLIHKIQLLGNGDFDALCIISKDSTKVDALFNDAEVVKVVEGLSIPTISAIECQGERPAVCAHTGIDFASLQQFGEYLKRQAEVLFPTAAPILAKAKEEAAQRKAEEEARRQAQEAARKQAAEAAKAAEAARRAAAAQPSNEPTIDPEKEVERLNGVLSGKVYEISKLKRKLRRRKVSVVVAYVLLALVLAAVVTLYFTSIISLNL